jgi:hypothetical protein
MPKPTVVSTIEVLAQGAVLEISFDAGTTWAALPGLEKIPRIGTEGSFVEMTSIDELVKRFGKGTRNPPEWELPCKRIGDDATQDLLIARAIDDENEAPVKFRATYRTGDILEADVVLNGFYMDEASQGDTPQLFGVKGQQTGDIVTSKVV